MLVVSAAVVLAAEVVGVVPASVDVLACEVVAVASTVVMPTVDDSVVCTVVLAISAVVDVGLLADIDVLA